MSASVTPTSVASALSSASGGAAAAPIGLAEGASGASVRGWKNSNTAPACFGPNPSTSAISASAASLTRLSDPK